MLRTGLGAERLAHFLRDDFGKRPFALPGAAESACQACRWDGLDAILRSEPAPDVLVVSKGKLVEDDVPRTLSALRTELFPRGVGIVVRHPQREFEPLRALSRALAEDVYGEQRLLVFATPRGTHGFGWHYDAEEVFILQTEGQKTYYFRANTIDPNPMFGAQPDFSRIRHETTPTMACTLVAGDLLYLPRGTWHIAQPDADSLSISLGVVPA